MADPTPGDVAVAQPRYAPVGAVVYNSYWQEHYTVLSHNDGGTITVRWHGDARGRDSEVRETTHRTPLHPDDRIVEVPAPSICVRCRGHVAITRDGLCSYCDDHAFDCCRDDEADRAIEAAEFRGAA